LSHLDDAFEALRVLPSPPEGTAWGLVTTYDDEDKRKLTVAMTLLGDDGRALGSGKIAVDLYGWSAVTSRGASLISAYLDSLR